ncbi:MAG: DUF4382 domain-containing protein [Desulfobacterales bacterium]
MFIIGILASSLLVACGGGGSGGSSGGTGELSMSLTDTSLYQYQAVYVTIDKIKVHRDDGGGWKTVASPLQTFNLLELVNGVREDLGLATLDVGHYTQMRLIIGDTPDDSLNIFSQTHPFANYVILPNGMDSIHELKVTSGPQTGVKLVNGFDINTNQTTELILDFDVSKSVIKAGSSGQWHLKPTIKVLDTLTHAIIDGTVTEDETGNNLQGVLVSAQLYNDVELDEKDWVLVQAATTSDINGEYALFLSPGTYNIVAFAEGYNPGCIDVEALTDTVQTQPFILIPATETGTIGGNVTISGGSTTQYVTISFRQVVTCNGGTTTIEVTMRNIANGGNYSVNLPAGTYRVVASTFGKNIQASDVELFDGDVISDLDFTL